MIRKYASCTRLIIGASSLAPAATFACTVCDSGTGQQVRAGISNEHFWPTLLGVIAPFPVMLLVIALIHAVPKSKKHNATGTPN